MTWNALEEIVTNKQNHDAEHVDADEAFVPFEESDECTVHSEQTQQKT